MANHPIAADLRLKKLKLLPLSWSPQSQLYPLPRSEKKPKLILIPEVLTDNKNTKFEFTKIYSTSYGQQGSLWSGHCCPLGLISYPSPPCSPQCRLTGFLIVPQTVCTLFSRLLPFLFPFLAHCLSSFLSMLSCHHIRGTFLKFLSKEILPSSLFFLILIYFSSLYLTSLNMVLIYFSRLLLSFQSIV